MHHDELEALAGKIEATLTAVNDRLLDLADLDADGLVDAFVEVQARLLQFDEYALGRFREAVEAARVKTYSQGNIFMASVLCSAIALSEFKKQPRRATGSMWAKRLDALRARSTNAVSLGVFTTTSLYALLGSKAYKKLRDAAKRRRSLTLP